MGGQSESVSLLICGCVGSTNTRSRHRKRGCRNTGTEMSGFTAAACKMSGSDPRAEQYSEIAMVAMDKRDFVSAIKAYQAAMELAPGDKVYPYALGKALHAHGNPQGAAQMYMHSLAIAPDWGAPRAALEQLGATQR